MKWIVDIDRSTARRTSGTALLSSLFAIALLAIISVAFVQSTRFERQTAASHLNGLRAEMACDAAAADALALLAKATATDDYAVVQTGSSQDPPHLLVARTSTPGQVGYTPLVSGGRSIDPLTFGEDEVPKTAELFRDPGQLAKVRLPVYLAESYGNQPAEAGWLDLPPEPGFARARFAYWIEDLQGRLDLEVAGNIDDGGRHRRGRHLNTADSPSEIALATLFEPEQADAAESEHARKLVEARGRFVSDASVLQVVPGIGALRDNDPRLNLYPGLGFEESEPQVIPSGFGFQEEGKRRYNLNDLVHGENAVAEISRIIARNLPDFARTRAGGMAPEIYLRNIAASMVDYADPDSIPTTDGSTYRGIDSYPFVSQWFLMTAYTERSENSATLINRHFLEVWNISDQEVEGTLQFKPVNGYVVSVGGETLDFANPSDRVRVDNQLKDVQIALEPNEKRVFDMGSVTYTVQTNAYPAAKIGAQATYESNYAAYWQAGSGEFRLIDRPANNVYGAGKSFVHSDDPAPNSETDWNCSIPGLLYRSNPEESSSTYIDGCIGDPRSAFYMKGVQDQSAYATRASVGGRLIRIGLEGLTYGECKPAWWPDSGYDDAPGTPIGRVDVLPNSIDPPPPKRELAMSRIANRPNGTYQSITELGNVFDPAQWRQYVNQDKQIPLDETVRRGLADISDQSIPDSRFGGGMTLRIGRPEFSRFVGVDADSRMARSRATDLLGLFAVSDSRRTRGLININTARFDTLRALGAGIELSNPAHAGLGFDPSSSPDKLFGPTLNAGVDRVEGDVLADAIIRNRPYFSDHEFTSRVRIVSADGQQELLWGNANAWSPKEMPASWRDAAAEEYLRQIYDLVTVRSRNFRLHLVGQAIDRQGRPVATRRRIVDVYLRPNRDHETQEILSIQPEILYAADQ